MPSKSPAAICAVLWFGLMSGAASAQTGMCVDDYAWAFSTDGDHAFADYAACLRPQEPEVRLHCRNGSPFPNILVQLSADVEPNQHVVMTFTVGNADYQTQGVTYWNDVSQTAGFDGNMDFDGPLIRAMTQNDTFSVGGYAIHMVDAAAAITAMLSHCGRG